MELTQTNYCSSETSREIVCKKKKPRINLVGKRYGRLTVLSLVEDDAKASIPTRWLCRCDCGNEKVVQGSNLKNGNSQSCGCWRKERASRASYRHGKTNTRLHYIWADMRARCNNPNEKSYPNYGGRGIKVCSEWRKFLPFYEWAVANGYRDDLSLDRLDNDGNYCPENCKWSTKIEQAENKRNNIRVEFNGEFHTTAYWSRYFNCHSQSVYREILSAEGRVRKGAKNEIDRK